MMGKSFVSACLLLLTAQVPTQPAAAQAVPPAPQGKFLHLSDIHFDPFADPALFDALNGADADQWQAIFERSVVITPSTMAYQDTNYPLLKSMLQAAQNAGSYDYVVYTGDYLAHGFLGRLSTQTPADRKAFAIKTATFVNLMIRQAFPASPLFATIGNNDSDCDDYKLKPGGDILTGVAASLPEVSQSPSAAKDFAQSGTYVAPHPTVPNLDFVVLSIFWSSQYANLCQGTPNDPAGEQLRWLDKTLAAERNAGRRVTVLMHIPPGIDGFSSRKHPQYPGFLWAKSPDYLDGFQKLTAAYKDILVGGYAGHTHMDEFRVLSDTAPYLAIRMAPSVSPYNGNRPAFTAFTYDPKDGSALDYSVSTMSNAAAWAEEYRFSKAYGYKRYDAASLQRLATQISTSKAARQSFGNYYAGGNYTPAGQPGSWPYFSCALTQFSAASYSACVAAGKAQPRSSRAGGEH